MFDLRELYQELILEHSKWPRHAAKPAGANCRVEGSNPLCGDQVTVYLELDHERVRDIGFQGSGCAIATASASMMTESVQGKTRAEAEALFAQFHRLVTASRRPLRRTLPLTSWRSLPAWRPSPPGSSVPRSPGTRCGPPCVGKGPSSRPSDRGPLRQGSSPTPP